MFTLAKVSQPNSKADNFFTVSEKGYPAYRKDTLCVITIIEDDKVILKTEPGNTGGLEPKEFYSKAEQFVRDEVAKLKGISTKTSKGQKELDDVLKVLTKRVYFFWPKAQERYLSQNKEV